MAKKLDPKIGEILKEHGFGKEAVWDCHGTWVVYHWVLERIAAARGIEFHQPHIIEADTANGIAVVCVTGTLGDRTIWSTGEASPRNNKNSYPWAMAEKRAKDRVTLNLIGLQGLVYSEEEADEFKATRPPTSGRYNKTKAKEAMQELSALIHDRELTPDEQMLDAHLADHRELLEQVERDWPEWLFGIEGNNDFVGFHKRVEDLRHEMREREAIQGAAAQ